MRKLIVPLLFVVFLAGFCNRAFCDTPQNEIDVHQFAHQMPIGILGKPLGSRIILMGRIPKRALLLPNPFEVLRVNGEPLRRPIQIEIRGAIKIPKTKICTFEGYENGSFIGYPTWLDAGGSVPQHSFGYSPFFLVTKIIEQKTTHSSETFSASDEGANVNAPNSVNVSQFTQQTPIGILGKPLGSRMVIEGVATMTPVGSSIRVEVIDGKKFKATREVPLLFFDVLKIPNRPPMIWSIPPFKSFSTSCKLEGYEQGEFSVPYYMTDKGNLKGFCYQSYFIVTKIIEQKPRQTASSAKSSNR